MRSVVLTLWNNILDPENNERLIDMISFFTLVFNGQITDDEVQEILRGQAG